MRPKEKDSSPRRELGYQSAVLLAQKQKNEGLTAMQKETERVREEREQVAPRQQEHIQAMVMQQFQYQQGQAQAQMRQQQQQQQGYYNTQAAQNATMASAAGGRLDLMGAATMCCVT